jgi:hypothetical protein
MSIGGPPAGVAGEARLGTMGDGRPAGLGRGDGSPAGNREVNPAGLGSGDGRPEAIGVPGPATPGVSAAGAAGCGTARTERFAICAGLASATPASTAQAQPRRRARRGFERAFTADSWKGRRDPAARTRLRHLRAAGGSAKTASAPKRVGPGAPAAPGYEKMLPEWMPRPRLGRSAFGCRLGAAGWGCRSDSQVGRAAARCVRNGRGGRRDGRAGRRLGPRR